jgi:hypothetical protein
MGRKICSYLSAHNLSAPNNVILLNDPEEVKDAIMFSVDADWADFEEQPNWAVMYGTISDGATVD